MLAIRRLLDRRLLLGRALARNGRPVGYAYFVPQGTRAIVGDLFVRAGCEGHLPIRLLESTLNAACLHQGVRRVEGQLMFLDQIPRVGSSVAGTMRTFRRALMLKSGLGSPAAPVFPVRSFQFLPWVEGQLMEAAELVSASYRDHVDALINDDYASVTGARRALVQTTRDAPGRPFFAPAAIVARESDSRTMAGICLGSLVSDAVGHVAQLCVAPSSRGRGLGSELLSKAIRAFSEAGCDAVSLTVTASNSRAVRLYERHGFRTIASFPAFVWQRA